MISKCNITGQMNIYDRIYAVKDKLLPTKSAKSLSMIGLPRQLCIALASLGQALLPSQVPSEVDEWHNFVSKLKNVLKKELNDLTKIIKARHKTFAHLVNDDSYMNHIHEAIWEA